ncbi:hypothetical protein B0H16DRAFT_1470673 [Mycena metata]|uniref:Uncharacterized protein n=1 Tax=Mycena metata TaxID=1033252 RepID=A0AAD7HTQ3_9AGAR|nr:hypothetical protein B0H16DRAFT_1470673 [Mycena metata]
MSINLSTHPNLPVSPISARQWPAVVGNPDSGLQVDWNHTYFNCPLHPAAACRCRFQSHGSGPLKYPPSSKSFERQLRMHVPPQFLIGMPFAKSRNLLHVDGEASPSHFKFIVLAVLQAAPTRNNLFTVERPVGLMRSPENHPHRCQPASQKKKIRITDVSNAKCQTPTPNRRLSRDKLKNRIHMPTLATGYGYSRRPWPNELAR